MTSDQISVSVIIPARNEERYIAGCLKSILANQVDMGKVEILVSDGRSTDQTRSLVRQFTASYPNVHLLDNEKQIVSTALNLGIRQARGQYIFVLGAHAEYPLDYLRICIEEMERTKADVVGGSLRTEPGAKTMVAKAIALLSQHRFGVGGSQFRLGRCDRFVDTVPYPAYKREIFDRVGLYDETLVRHQDFELNSRIRAAGGRIFLSSRVQNIYFNVPTVLQLARQAYSNGLWLGRTWLRRPGSFSARHAAPVLFVIVLLATIIFGPLVPYLYLLSKLMLSAYAFLAIVSTMQLSFRRGLLLLFTLPWLFFIHHLSYGIGTLTGLMTWQDLGRSRIPMPQSATE